jgi:O-antigen/teichoic acid export membrane protein
MPDKQSPPLARAGRNLILKSTGEVLARLCLFLLFIYAARALGVAEFGRYSYAASLAALALVGMDLGLNMLFVRDGARDPSRVPAYAGTLLIIKCGLAALVLAAMYLFCRLMAFGIENTLIVMSATLAQALWGLSEFGVAGLNAVERMDQEAKVKTLARFAALTLAGGGILFGFGIWGLLGGIALANALAALMALTLLGQKGGFKPRLKGDFMGYLLKESLPLALVNVFILVYFRVDIVMLGR